MEPSPFFVGGGGEWRNEDRGWRRHSIRFRDLVRQTSPPSSRKRRRILRESAPRRRDRWARRSVADGDWTVDTVTADIIAYWEEMTPLMGRWLDLWLEAHLGADQGSETS